MKEKKSKHKKLSDILYNDFGFHLGDGDYDCYYDLRNDMKITCNYLYRHFYLEISTEYTTVTIPFEVKKMSDLKTIIESFKTTE